MKSTPAKIIGLSLIFGLSIWIIDTALDSIFFYEGSFWELLIFGPPAHEIYIRLLVLACFLSFGIITSSLVFRLQRAEQSLKAKETDLRTTLDSIGDAVISTDTLGRIQSMNPIAENLTGWSENEALDQPLLDVFYIVDAKSRNICSNPTQKVLQTGMIQGLANDTILITKEGKEYQIADSASPIYNDQGKVTGTVLVFRDVSEEYRKNRVIAENEAFLTALLNSITQGISVLNPDLSVRYVNQVMEDIFAESMPLIGKKCYACYHGLEQPCEPCPVLRSFESRQTETEIVSGPEGSSVEWLKIFCHPILDPDSKEVTGVVEFVQDITAQIRFEQELRQNQILLAEAERLAQVGAWSWDIQEDKWIFSQNWMDLHGCSTPPVNTEELLQLAHAKDIDRIREAFKQTLTDRSRYDVEHRIVRQDTGEIRYVQGFGYVVSDEWNNPLKMYGAVMDVSQQKMDKLALQHSKEAAEAANNAKSEFLANMSHEIRTPLNGVMGMLQLMQSTNLDAEQQEYIDMSLKSSQRLNRLLTDILDLSKVEAGKMEINREGFNLKEVLETIQEIFWYEVQQKGLEFSYDLEPEIPDKLFGDSTRLTQILFNLVGNAVKYTQKGQVRLDAQVKSSKDSKYTLLFSISDTGSGIPYQFQERIFETFTQANDSGSPYTRKYEGAGLGLPMVKRLADLMGGNVFLESEQERGTTVYVLLPFDTVEREAEQPFKADRPEKRVSAGGRQLLLAEDDGVNQKVAQRILEKLGYQVKVAQNGKEALQFLQAESFDLVLMDIKMPIMDGIEATKQIRNSNLKTKDIPLIALTAYAMKGECENFLEAGMDDYIPKPVDRDKLESTLKKNLSDFVS
jgi:PAS domain S-box-containing protein